MPIDTMPAAQAVEVLIHDYGRLVFQVIYGLTGDWQESQDLTQDTFLKALRAIDAARLASGAHFQAKAWLLQIAVNMVRMQRRRSRILCLIPSSSLYEEGQKEMDAGLVYERAAPLQPAGYGMGVAGEDPAELVAERDAIQRAMAHLPHVLRLCLLLSVVGGLSAREIAPLLDLSEGAVRQRLSRARKRFRQLYLQESGEALSDDSHPTRPGAVRVRRAPLTAQQACMAGAALP